MTATPTQLMLHQKQPGRFSREEQLLKSVADRLGIPVVAGSERMMERGRIAVDRTSLVAGTVPFVTHALRRLGVDAPEHVPYPECLAPWLHRRVWKAPRLRDVFDSLHASGPVFIKPAQGWKRFTGFVLEFRDDYRLNGVSKNAPVWVSEQVTFLSEWRAYVVHGEVLGIEFADHGGDPAVRPDEDAIRAAIAVLVASRTAVAGFAIDFGVTSSGQTALVEMNDGIAVGAYGALGADAYWAMTAARWFELIADAVETRDSSNLHS